MGRKAFVSRAAAAARAAAAESDDGDGGEKKAATEPKEQAEASPSSIANAAAPSAAPAPAPAASAASDTKASDNGEDGDEAAPSAVGGKETRGQMVQRHKRELKAQKEASKRLGKKKKDEASAAEAALAARHEAELKELRSLEPEEEGGGSGGAAAAADGAADSLSRFKLDGDGDGGDRKGDRELPNLRKGSKAARKRAERLALDAERERARDEERAALAGTGKGSLEARELEETALRPLGLAVFDVPADGHCLYAALAHQLAQQAKEKAKKEKEEGGGGEKEGGGGEKEGGEGGDAGEDGGSGGSGSFGFTVASLRTLAARHIREHSADFEPFIDDEELEQQKTGGEEGEGEGGEGEEESDLTRVERYCRRLEGTAAWGGQPELQALASALPATIRVLSAGMEPVVVEGKAKGPELTICYLRHAFGLGEHYNSTVAAKEEEGGGESDESGESESEG